MKNVDYVHTDTWVDLEFFNDPSFADKKTERIERMLPCQRNHQLLANSNAKVMHEMPIQAGYEISKELVNDPHSIIFQQAESRRDAQKAVIIKLLHRYS